MIEAVSSPLDLTQWDASIHPFYLEFFGETSPVLDMAFSEVIPAGGQDPQTTSPAPVYEYWWTLGHKSAAPHGDLYESALGAGDGAPPDPQAPVWENFKKDVAARVYLYFPISGGWRIREIVATVKYLVPLAQHQDWWAKAVKDFGAIAPLLGGAGAVAGFVPGGATASKWLQTVGKLHPGSMPQDKSYPWSVEKVTEGGGGVPVMQGVVWNLPRSLMRDQGGRVTGSLAVTVYPAPQQAVGKVAEPGSGTEQPTVSEQLPAKAHAVVYPNKGAPIWVPGATGLNFIELQIAPRIPGATPTPLPASSLGG